VYILYISEIYCKICLLLRYTYGPEYHVQGHGNVEIERIIIAHISTEEHSNKDDIISVKKEIKKNYVMLHSMV
jgi:hypothetical protein